MYKFDYVTKEEYKNVKDELIRLINLVQDEVRDYFTFQFKFIGSSSRNMITYDKTTNVGYDFDVDIIINDEDEEFTAEEIKKLLVKALQKYMCGYNYNKIEDSKRVITIKKVDRFRCCILYSCDFAVVYNYVDHKGNKRQQFIFNNKRDNVYSWQEQPRGFYKLYKKEKWLKKSQRLWQEVRDCYLDKKNNNTNPDKKSRSLYAEAVNEIYDYYKGPRI